MPALSQAGYQMPKQKRRKPLQMQRCNQLGAEEEGSNPQGISRPICPTRSHRSQPKRLDTIVVGVVPFRMLHDCHGAAMDLQSSNSTLGLASSLATSSNNHEDLSGAISSARVPREDARSHY